MPTIITYDIGSSRYKDSGATDADVTRLYQNVAAALELAEFERIERSVFRHPNGGASPVIAAVTNLRKIPEFVQYVDRLHTYETQRVEDLTGQLAT